MKPLAELPLVPSRRHGNARACDVREHAELVDVMIHRIAASRDMDVPEWMDRGFVLSSGDEIGIASSPAGVRLTIRAALRMGRPSLRLTIESSNPFLDGRSRAETRVDAREAASTILRGAALALAADAVPDGSFDDALDDMEARETAITAAVVDANPDHAIVDASVSPPGPWDDDVRIHASTDHMDASIRLGRDHAGWMPWRMVAVGITTTVGRE